MARAAFISRRSLAPMVLGLAMGLAGCGGCGDFARGFSKGFKKGFTQSYDASFKDSFVKSFDTSCIGGANKQGMAIAQAQPLCHCMGLYMVGHHTTTDLSRMSLAPSGPESKAALTEAAKSCMVVPAASK